MKKFFEEAYGISYCVIEYDIDDLMCGLPNTNVISEIFKAKLEHKYLKIIDRTIGETINYYKDGMKHNDYGPSVIYNTDHKKYHIEDSKLKEDEFKNWKRTKLMDDMLDGKQRYM